MPTVKCVVACRNANGEPDFFPCTVNASQEQYDEGEHYDEAEQIAAEQGYEKPFLVYDENDGPAWLFDRMFPKGNQPANPNMDPVDLLNREELGRFAREVREALYPNGPNSEWDSDTPQAIADVLRWHGLAFDESD